MNIGQNVQYEILNTASGQHHPIVTIRVDSPRDTPLSSPREESSPLMQLPHTIPPSTPSHQQQELNRKEVIGTQDEQSSIDLSYNDPIDVNLPCDTTNVFYDYPSEIAIDASATSTTADVAEGEALRDEHGPPNSS